MLQYIPIIIKQKLRENLLNFLIFNVNTKLEGNILFRNSIILLIIAYIM
jgi:hypothetical protein